MKETAFNIFLYVDENILYELGVVCHDIEGTDEEKLNFLKQNVENDFKTASRFSLPDSFRLKIKDTEYNALNYDRYREMSHNGTVGILFEEIFRYYNASITPIMCVTVIHDGQIKIDGTETIVSNPTKYPKEVYEVLQPNFLDEYFTVKGFRLTDLINDDFFEAIRVTFNKKLYVSSIKLMMSCLDSIAYLEYGDIPQNIFKKWLNSFADLSPLGINSEELWEFRNSILHMTNLDSRKTINKTVNRIQFYISLNDKDNFKKSDEGKYFNYKNLITVIAFGIEKWGDSYNADRQKIEKFIDRYDRVLSDRRYAYLKVE